MEAFVSFLPHNCLLAAVQLVFPGPLLDPLFSLLGWLGVLVGWLLGFLWLSLAAFELERRLHFVLLVVVADTLLLHLLQRLLVVVDEVDDGLLIGNRGRP